MIKKKNLYPPLLLFFVFCFSVVHAAPPLWTQNDQLSLGSAFSDEVDACSRDNEIYTVWSDDRTGNREIFFAASQNAGQTWCNEERLTDTPGESIQPAIAYDKKNLYVVWREKTDDASHIYYKKWDGSMWSDGLLLSGDYENSKRPDIASTTLFPGSYLYIVWDSEKNDKSTAYLIRSNNAGQSFSEPEPVTTGDWDTKEPAIWGGARDAYVAWADNREGNWSLFFRRWGEVQPLSEVNLSALPDCHSPAIGGKEPYIYAAWQCVEKDAVYADIYLSSSADHGVSWTVAEKLTDGEAESVSPRIITSDEINSKTPVPWVFWQDGRNGEWQIMYSTLDAGYWMLDVEDRSSHIQSLTDANKPAVMLDIIATPGQIHAFWTRIESNAQANVMYARRDTVAPQRPGTPLHFDLTAVVGYDDDTQITFSWEGSESEGIVKYNVYSKADDEDFTLAGNADSASYDVQGESGKTYRIYVEAVDEVGNVSLASAISPGVICDSTPPEITLHSPRSNSTIRGAIPVIASIHDSNLLEYSIEYGITAVPSVWQQLAAPFYEEADRERIMTWETSELDGIYTLRISAKDEAGNQSRVEAMVNIDSRPPMAVLPGEVVPLTDPDSEWTYGMPAWSPAGDEIAFHSDAGGTEDIWLMSPTAGVHARLTRNTAVEHNPAWSPAGEMIAFQSLSVQSDASEDVSWDIWAVNVSGGDIKQLTHHTGSDMNPAWSLDGSSIAFDSDRDGDSEIWLITNVQSVLTGADPQLVQLTDNDWEDKHPTWSPDGSKVIFQSSRRGNWDLFEIGIDGTDLNVIVATPADEIEPDWSPDRKRVLFSTNEPGDHYEIRAINWPEASTQSPLSPKGEDARHAHWSPTMDSIAYEREGSLYVAALVYPAGDLEAVISSPRGGEALTGWTDVKGTARGDNFQRYSLQYSSYAEPDDFHTIGGESTSPVPETGFLGKWHTEALEGEFLLRLLVTGRDGGSVTDTVRVLIANQLPFILIDEPQNGMVTKEAIITVSGRTGQRTTVTINDSEVDIALNGGFSRKIQLSEGANNITIKARNPSDQGGEYALERTIFLDTASPGITIETPRDFQVIHVPYVTVEGSVDERAEVNILSTRVWLDNSGRFQRKIACSEGTNLIPVVAFDGLGHYASVSRRVIFQRDTEITSDIYAPAVTDVFPDNRAVVAGRNLQFSAVLVDDIGIDPLSIVFSFDDEEISSEEWELDVEMPVAEKDFPLDQYPIIHFSYRPARPVSEGEHSFRIEIQDTSGNTEESVYSFSVDTVAPEAIVSAVLDGANRIKVIAVANKPLTDVTGGVIYDAITRNGYSLSSFAQVDGRYETALDISPSQRNFTIDFTAETYLGDEISASGYMAWSEVRHSEGVVLGVEGGALFLSKPVDDTTNDLVFVLRSQDGLDADLLALQRSDAEYRRLRLSGLAYALSVSEELKEEALQGVLSLPVLDADVQRLVMFHWDEKLRQWHPLDRSGSSATADITETGVYALFADVEPPIISDVSPTDAGEVPLDRFFVEATILDIGSGISNIEFMVDGKRADYDYDPVEGRLTYFPSMLEWGLHQMEITAADRAGNVAEFSNRFLTKESFQFILVRAYPNPASNEVNIEFKLTRLADVKLRVYTIAGEPVYSSEKKETAKGTFLWKCENNAGGKVASGIYIYCMEAVLYESRIHKQGAIAVVK